MDKPQNVKHGNSSKFSNTNKRHHFNKQQSGKHKLLGDNASQFSENSKKKREKIRSLRAVTVSTTLLSAKKMGCHASERFKIPNTFFNDCNGVYHASVPRKLRSAMKKRSRESILHDSKKVNQKINGIESAEKGSVKKSKKQGIKQNCSPRESVSGPITKDEEEVAETLFALAEMFPHSDYNHNNKELVGESLLENSSGLQVLEENTNASLEASATGPCQNASPCPEEASKCLPGIVKLENCNKVSLHDSELCLAIGSNVTRQSIISQSKRELDALDAVRDDDSERKQHLIKEQVKNEGLALWPGLSTVASTSHAYQQSFATEAPDWLEPAIFAPKQDLMESSTCSFSGKISEVAIHKRSWKRCAAHVYISHIIQSFEAPKKGVSKESKLNECHEMRTHEGSTRGALSELHNLNEMRNGITCATGRSHHESKNGILQQQMQCHYSNMSHAAPRPRVWDPQKQSFNFLSLSAGSYGAKVDNNCNKIGSRLQQLSQLQVPYFQSLAQQQRVVMPIHMPQSHYASTFYLDQPTLVGPQLRLQQPQYYGSPLCGTQYSSTVSNKQELQNFWEVQQAAQVRSSVNCNIMRTQHPNWQNGTPCAQSIFPHSTASQEIFGSKVTSITGQQQQLIPQDKWARSSSSSYYM